MTSSCVRAARDCNSARLLLLVMCLIMLLAVANAAPYETKTFSSLSRGLSQMHSELPGIPDFAKTVRATSSRATCLLSACLDSD